MTEPALKNCSKSLNVSQVLVIPHANKEQQMFIPLFSPVLLVYVPVAEATTPHQAAFSLLERLTS